MFENERVAPLPPVADIEAGQKLEAAQQADYAYRAQRHAELSHRLRWLFRLLAFLDSEWPTGILIGGVALSILMVVIGISRGGSDSEPWELRFGMGIAIASLSVLVTVPTAIHRLGSCLHRAFEREGLTFDEPPSN